MRLFSYKKMRNYFLILLLALTICSCSSNSDKDKGNILAEVGSKYLYTFDIKNILPEKVSEKDSIDIVNSFIENWVRKELIIQKAELNLSNNQKDVAQQLENYRAALLIYKYEQQILNQKLDTVITDDDLAKYYNKHSGEFLLDDNIVKSAFIQLSKKDKNISKIKKWIKSSKEEDQENLKDASYQSTGNIYLNDEWVYFNIIRSNISLQLNDSDILKENKLTEVEDSLNHYFIYIKDVKLKGEIAPMLFVKNNIRSAIINKRKLEFINDLENKIYNEAVQEKSFIIHTKKNQANAQKNK